MAITGMSGRILGQTGVAATFTDKACTDVSPVAAVRTVFRITDRTLAHWDSTQAVVVEVDDGGGFAAADSADYTIQYLGGVVTFDPALGVGDLVQVTGKAYPMAAFSAFTDWELSAEREMLDETWLNETAEGVKPGLLSGEVSAGGFFWDDYFIAKLIAGGIAVLSLDTGDGTYDLYTLVSKVGTKVAKGELTTEARTFKVDGNFYYNAD